MKRMMLAALLCAVTSPAFAWWSGEQMSAYSEQQRLKSRIEDLEEAQRSARSQAILEEWQDNYERAAEAAVREAADAQRRASDPKCRADVPFALRPDYCTPNPFRTR